MVPQFFGPLHEAAHKMAAGSRSGGRCPRWQCRSNAPPTPPACCYYQICLLETESIHRTQIQGGGDRWGPCVLILFLVSIARMESAPSSEGASHRPLRNSRGSEILHGPLTTHTPSPLFPGCPYANSGVLCRTDMSPGFWVWVPPAGAGWVTEACPCCLRGSPVQFHVLGWVLGSSCC